MYLLFCVLREDDESWDMLIPPVARVDSFNGYCEFVLPLDLAR